MRNQRMIALLIMVIPGIIGVYGWTMMRNAFYDWFDPLTTFPWVSFGLGLLLFLFGLAFIGGFIFFRDKKRKKVQPRFLDDMDDND